MTGVGLISYPLYLWHWPLLAFLSLWPGYAASEIGIACTGGSALLLSIATYVGIDKPLQSYRQHPMMFRLLLGQS